MIVGQSRAGLIGFVVAILLLTVLFHRPIHRLIEFAWGNDLYSHVLLIPLVTVYLAWGKRNELIPGHPVRGRGYALIPMMVGLVPLIAWWVVSRGGTSPPVQDSLSLLISSFVLFCLGIGLFSFGTSGMRSIVLPASLLIFMAPFPTWLEAAIERFFQHFSADAASLLFQIARTPVVRDGMFFHLPGISLEVARECSGIRSSLVLFITAIIAGYLFLNSPWRRAVLALVVVPLAILRNGLRIFTIGMLCVQIDPAMIHSWVHRKGGPLFFALSLVPFFAVLLLLRKGEQTRPVLLEKRAEDGRQAPTKE